MVRAFYQCEDYEARRDRKAPRGPLRGDITFSDRHPAARDRILSYFNDVTIERAGVLRGDYLLNEGGQLLVDRKGDMIAACMSLEDRSVAQFMATDFTRPELVESLRAMLGVWDQIPMAHNLPVLCDPYCSNYYHFSLEMTPRARYFTGEGPTTLIMTKNALARPFQRDLLKHALSGVSFLPLEGCIRVRDPILAHDSMSAEGIFWLRQASRISAVAGKRRIYLRRAATGTRTHPGGGISHSPGFDALLRDFGFETVDFGNGENGVAAQVALLEGAGLILSAHGAALTNLAYLAPELKVIEIFGPVTRSACFMHLAATLGFQYHGLLSDICDDRSDIVVDLEELYEALRARV